MSTEEDLTPKDNKEYKTKEYWDQRYQKYSFFKILIIYIYYFILHFYIILNFYRFLPPFSFFFIHCFFSPFRDKGLYDWFKGTLNDCFIIIIIKRLLIILSVGYPDIKRLVNKYVQKDNSVLNVGCGNSYVSIFNH